MSFFDNYVRLCNKEGIAPTTLAVQLGIAKSTVSRWSKGQVPNKATRLKIADHFGVSESALMGEPAPVVSEADALAQSMQKLKERPELRTLLDAADGISASDVEDFAKWLKRMRGADETP